MREIAVFLSDKQWRDALDDYLYEDKIHSEIYIIMTDRQKDIIQEIKRSKSRKGNINKKKK